MDSQIQVQHNIGNTLVIPNEIRTFGRTFLADNFQAGIASILVDNTTDFSTNSLTLLSVIGAENAEFATVTGVTNPTNLAISTTLFTHSLGEIMQNIEYNQFIVQKSASINGTYTTLNTFFVQATQQYTQVYDPAGLQTDYYRVQMQNSVSGNTSNFSIPVSPSAFDPESVGAKFNNIKSEFGISDADPIITTQFLLTALNSARDTVRDMMAGFKQSWLEEFEYPIQLLAGRNYAILPDDYDMKYNNGKLLAVRYPRINGFSPYPLTYIDKKEWNSVGYSLKYSYAVGTTTSGSTTLQVRNVGDFQPAGGTIFISSNQLSDATILEVTYTGLDLVTNTFTGCTGITRNIVEGTQLFSFPTFSSASYYTCWFNDPTSKGWIVFNRPIPQIMHGRNIYIDYYKHMYPVTDINVVLPEPFVNIYNFYIKYAIKYRRDNSTDIEKDPDYARFTQLVGEWIQNHYIGQGQTIITRG